ncbi:MAG: 23S rRNA (adenine(2503)-C(2))-methyltransferase RlmN [Bacteroidales bacterium]|jgi:23S rRNA (adenine2503-C2)-methyltransferase|nr:23S rRNA (adenine(2503)-C(2))-methyltransferase RlmN [Bacteroidales bacterium]MCR4571557.1 23S rRNA (adenine(2503)-C(2))-methyltransferase RlmN [Bacteroidales bacterium]
MEKLLGKTPEELEQVVASCGMKPFVAKQIARWMYVSKVRSFDEMTNISKAGREKLAQLYELGVSAPAGKAESSDGTLKYLFKAEGSAIESVVIPDGDRSTLCVSSQAGCRMNCKFCMTGRGGFHGHLQVSDILNQFISIDDPDRLTNTVFMGMGEPLDNYSEVSKAIAVLTSDWGFAWSPKRITVSSIGVLPELKKYLDHQKCHLAISLHNPFGEERVQMMPVEKAWPIREVVDLIRTYDWSGQRRVSFEYTMFAGWNDTKRHADALIRLLKGLECRVNLIRFHKIPDFPYDTTPRNVMEAFRDRLDSNGVTCTIRASRGEDILAACGLLAGQANK